MPRLGVFVGCCGTIGGIAMMIHGFMMKSYVAEWSVLEGAMLIAMSLLVFAVSRPRW